MEVTTEQLTYLTLLSSQYPSIRATSTAIVKLKAELNLPKGTEHFISDVHGEYEAFQHVLKNGSGSIKRKIQEAFPDLPSAEKRTLATLIYYPEEKLPLILQQVADEAAWYRPTLLRLLTLCRVTASKYTRSRVRQFLPNHFTDQELRLMAQMHKAITIIQLKLEGQIIKRRPHYQMEDRLLLEKINLEQGTISLSNTTYPLLDAHFPTVDPKHPYQLTDWEESVVEKLKLSFITSKRLQQHVRFLYSKGSMYLVYNGNLLYHGCIAMNEDGSFQPFVVGDNTYVAREFMDRVERLARQGYFATDDPPQKQYGLDAMWYLWSGPQSPLFGKDKMATLERYFIADKSTHTETRNAYYKLRDREDIARKILEAFGLDPDTGHIIN